MLFSRPAFPPPSLLFLVTTASDQDELTAIGLTVLLPGIIKGRGVRGPEGALICGALSMNAVGERLDGAAASQAFAISTSPVGPGGGGAGPWQRLWRPKLRMACPGTQDGVTGAWLRRLRLLRPVAYRAAPGGGARVSDPQLPRAQNQRRPGAQHTPYSAPAPSLRPALLPLAGLRSRALGSEAPPSVYCRLGNHSLPQSGRGWLVPAGELEFHLPQSTDGGSAQHRVANYYQCHGFSLSTSWGSSHSIVFIEDHVLGNGLGDP